MWEKENAKDYADEEYGECEEHQVNEFPPSQPDTQHTTKWSCDTGEREEELKCECRGKSNDEYSKGKRGLYDRNDPTTHQSSQRECPLVLRNPPNR